MMLTTILMAKAIRFQNIHANAGLPERLKIRNVKSHNLPKFCQMSKIIYKALKFGTSLS